MTTPRCSDRAAADLAARQAIRDSRIHVDHGKWTRTNPSTMVQARVYTYVEPDSPVGVMLGVHGVTRVVLHFEDGTSEWWEHRP